MILGQGHIDQLRELGLRLIDQHKAQILIPAQAKESGYWFGGGNIIQEEEGRILVCGRYRNAGDSRTGTGAGARGLEFAIFASNHSDHDFKKIISYSKSDLAHSSDIVSIEGGCLLQDKKTKVTELFISTEKNIAYPKQIINFQKPGTGVWSIDMIAGSASVESLDISTIKTVVSTQDANTLHIKDPVATRFKNDQTELIYCNHPFSWSSSNTGLALAVNNESSFTKISDSILPRGNSWDVACARITERLPIPQIGSFINLPPLSLYLYDGAECLRPLDQNPKAAKRPRGYSCEELGGLAWGWDNEFPKIVPISTEFPLFISPHSTGCSRYASAIFLKNGDLFATWQQAQPDESQPLVSNKIENKEIERILS